MGSKWRMGLRRLVMPPWFIHRLPAIYNNFGETLQYDQINSGLVKYHSVEPGGVAFKAQVLRLNPAGCMVIECQCFVTLSTVHTTGFDLATVLMVIIINNYHVHSSFGCLHICKILVLEECKGVDLKLSKLVKHTANQARHFPRLIDTGNKVHRALEFWLITHHNTNYCELYVNSCQQAHQNRFSLALKLV